MSTEYPVEKEYTSQLSRYTESITQGTRLLSVFSSYVIDRNGRIQCPTPIPSCHRGEYWDTAIPSGDIMRPEKKRKKKKEKQGSTKELGNPNIPGSTVRSRGGVGGTGATVLCHRLRAGSWVRIDMYHIISAVSCFKSTQVNWVRAIADKCYCSGHVLQYAESTYTFAQRIPRVDHVPSGFQGYVRNAPCALQTCAPFLYGPFMSIGIINPPQVLLQTVYSVPLPGLM